VFPIDIAPETLAFWLSPWVLGLLGLCVGSFLNVVVHRLPKMMERQWWRDVQAQLADTEAWPRTFAQPAPAAVATSATALEGALAGSPAVSLARPASACPHCGHRIRWYENIPLVSWLALRGRCSGCKARISARYPFVEVLTAALFVGVALRYPGQGQALLWCLAVALLVALAAIDWDTTLLPDSLNYPLLWFGLAAAALGWTIPLSTAVGGAIAGYLSLWSVYWLFKLTTGKEGMGYGDFKLLAALGAWLGWQAVLPIILMSSIIGAVVGIVLKATGGLRGGRYVPFGPFLAGGGLVIMLFGTEPFLRLIGWR